MTTRFQAGDQVIMRCRVRDSVATVASVTDDRVMIVGTTAEFCPITGRQVKFPDCWEGWRIEPLEVVG